MLRATDKFDTDAAGRTDYRCIWAAHCFNVRMQTVQSFPARRFQVWKYGVSHAQLLLRSTKEQGQRTRVDVAFKNVQALKLATSIENLVVRLASPEDAARIRAEAGILDADSNVFLLEGDGGIGWVIAGIAFGHEDEGDYSEPSPLLSGNWNGPGWRLPGSP